jgi:phosphoribosylamine---glycine ligase
VPNVLLVGGGAREHAIGWALVKNPSVSLYTVAQNHNPGLYRISAGFLQAPETDVPDIVEWARRQSIGMAVMGMESPLEAGLVDALEAVGIPSVGPRKSTARLETSKSYTRDLMKRHDVPAQAGYHYFTDPNAAAAFLRDTTENFALKPDGLTGGTGVRIMGEHFVSREEAIEYAQRVIGDRIGGAGGLVIEELLVGHEFTLQCFVDGMTLRPMPMARDYKRAFDGDKGPNTGSMGSYSIAGGLLPFVGQTERDEALGVLKAIVTAMQSEDEPYRGVMYGQFMLTSNGIRLIEINARFGDPEAINVLTLLNSDFYDICRAMVEGRLADADVQFKDAATVCVYVTPKGYGENPQVGAELHIDEATIESAGVIPFYAKVDEVEGRILTTRSRAIGLLGLADTVSEARRRVSTALKSISGPYHARTDIGLEAETSPGGSNP